MSQPSVTQYYPTRKRQANEDLRNKAKVLLLDNDSSNPSVKKQIAKAVESEEIADDSSPRLVYKPKAQGPEMKRKAVRNLQLDSNSGETRSKLTARGRSTRTRKPSANEGQDIRESFLKTEEKTVVFEKKGILSPRKKNAAKSTDEAPKVDEAPAAGSLTPKKATNRSVQDMSLKEIKDKLNKSKRLLELKASIDRFRKNEKEIEEREESKESDKPQVPQIRKFDIIEVEVPISPLKAARSPAKTFLSPVKCAELPKNASPQRRLLFAPKESSPVKTPTKIPAYQKYQPLSDSTSSSLSLPYSYRFLAEVFRSVDTISAMLFNRKETITMQKLKPAVQELLRRDFNINHLAQIKTVYPDAYTFTQEKVHHFGTNPKSDKYQLVITPVVPHKSGRNTPDADDVLRSASLTSMTPALLLERRRKFYNTLLEKTKDEHEKFLLSLESPMVIDKDKIKRWHPDFDVETCAPIERSELPQPPNVEKATSARDVLDKAKALFNCNTRMEKALQRLADAKMTSKSTSEIAEPVTPTTVRETGEGTTPQVDISIVDTPPATPTVQSTYNAAFKNLPKSLLEKVRARQAAKALEAMTRTSDDDKEMAMLTRLPDMARIMRNLFVAERKGVLGMEFVLRKLDNSMKTKHTLNELEEHIKLMCKIVPKWGSIHNVRKLDYLKLAKDVDFARVIQKLENAANEKTKL